MEGVYFTAMNKQVHQFVHLCTYVCRYVMYNRMMYTNCSRTLTRTHTVLNALSSEIE